MAQGLGRAGVGASEVCAHRRGEVVGGNGLEIEPWKMDDNWGSTMKLVETTIYILYDNDGVIDWILTIMIDNDDNLCQVEEIQTS